MRVADYLGADVNELLKVPPFSGWAVTRSVDEDLPEKEIRYVFEGHGFQLICDEAERVTTIFLKRGDAETLFEVPFSLSRREVLAWFGAPSNSGAAKRLPVLGDKGAWDRFSRPEGSIHVQYRPDRDEIEMVTLMLRGTEP